MLFTTHFGVAEEVETLYFGDVRLLSQKDPDVVPDSVRSTAFSEILIDSLTFEGLLSWVFEEPQRRGYPFASMSIRSVQPKWVENRLYLNPTLQLFWGEAAVLDTFLFEGIEHSDPRFLQRELQRYRGRAYDDKTARAIPSAFRQYPFLRLQSASELVRTQDGQTGLLLYLTEEDQNSFGGVVGYVPPKGSREGYFTGEIDLRILNLSGRGRRAELYWSKVNEYSQTLRLQFEEPWIWKTDFFGDIGFRQELRDTLVVIRSLEIGIGRRWQQNVQTRLHLSHFGSLPTPGGRDILGLEKLRTSSAGISFAIDRRNHFSNPTRGFRLCLESAVGRRQTEGQKDRWLLEADAITQLLWPIKEPWVLSQELQFRGRWLSYGEAEYAEHFWFGGVRSLRGYANDFFHGDEVGWLSLELRRLIGENSRIYAFFDLGYYRLSGEINFPRSYGIGLRLDSRMGIIGLDYGFGKGDTFSTAKIHVFLENRF